MPLDVNSLLFKYGVYLPVVLLRGERVGHHLRRLEETQWLPPADVERLQREKLTSLLQHSRAHVPFYRARFDRGAGPSGSPIEALAGVPLTTKQDLISFNRELRSERHRGPVTIKTTGGSTGQAVTVRKSRTATAWEQAANWRGFRWAGVDIGHRQGRFWGVPAARSGRARAAVVDWLAHRRRYSAFRFSADDMSEYVNDLRRFKPHYLYGYVSMLRCFAEFLLDSGQSIASPLRAVVCTSEPLTPPDRRLLERAFGAPVFNEYGCGELGTIAHECTAGGLHLHAENLLIEILIDPSDPSQGRSGEVVITELNNVAMPLIRYSLGDFAELSAEPCRCGRTLPTLRNVYGRSYDMIRNRHGQRLHGEFFMYIFEEVRQRGLGVDAFQVIQDDLDHLTVKLVPGEGFGIASEAFILQRIQSGFGSAVEISFERVNLIGREPSGKMRLVLGMESPRTSA